MADATIGTISAKVTTDNSQFDAGMKRSAQIVDATTRENQKAAKLQAEALAFSARFAADEVTDQALRIVKANKQLAAAEAELRQAKKYASVADEVEGNKLLAAAILRVAAARKEANAAASAVAPNRGGLQELVSSYSGTAVSPGSARITAARMAEAKAATELRSIEEGIREGLIGEAEGANAAAVAYERLQMAKRATAEATELDTVVTREHTGAELTDVQATSAVVRAAEGQQGIRAVERFITMIPGAGALLKNIFPLVGGAMFIEMLVHMGSELYEVEQKAAHAGEAFQRGFGEMDAKLSATNDELALSNSRLEDQAAKLSGHPANGLQTALLEAKVAADKLEEALDGDVKQFNALMKEHEVGYFAGALAGVAWTAGTSKEITQRQQKMQDASAGAASTLDSELAGAKTAHEQAMRQAGSNHAQAKAADDTYRAAEVAAQKKFFDTQKTQADQFAAWAKGRAAETAKMGAVHRFLVGDPGARVGEFQTAARLGERESTRAQLSAAAASDEATVKQLTQNKEMAALGSKAAEQKLKAMEAELAAEKIQFGITLKTEYDFWDARRNVFRAGSEQYNQIVEKQATLAVEGARQAHEKLTKMREQQVKETKDQYNAMVEATKAAGAQWLTQMQGADQMAAAQAARVAQASNAADARREGMLRLGSAGDEARGAAAIHLSENGRRQQDLAAQQQREDTAAQRQITVLTSDRGVVANNTGISETERQKQLDAIDEEVNKIQESIKVRDLETATRMDALKQQRELQALEDERRLESTTLMGGVNDALREFIRNSTDAGAAMKQWFAGSLNSTNDALVRMMTEPQWKTRGQWGNVGKEVFTQASGSLLKGAEGNLMKSLGLGGKADGTSEGSALWVRMAGSKSIGGGSESGGILAKIEGLFGHHSSTGSYGLPNLPGMNNEWGGGSMPDLSGIPDDTGEGYDGAAGGLSGAAAGSVGFLSKIEKLVGFKHGDTGGGSASSPLLMGGSNPFGLANGSSEATALWVKIAGTVPGLGGGSGGDVLFGSGSTSGESSGGGLGGFFAKLFGGGSGSGGGGGDLSSVADGGATEFGGFASGTDFAPGGAAWVGEAGPEIVNLPRGSQVVPNHKLNDYLGGGDTHHHWNVDARGANDPAMVEAAVQRGIRQAAPQIIAASNAAQTNRNGRVPASRR